MTLVALAFAAYLIGSIPFAVVVSRLFGLPHPRSYGSGNPGATNVLRTGRKAAAALTLFGDAAKGWLAVFAAPWVTAGKSIDLLSFAPKAAAGFRVNGTFSGKLGTPTSGFVEFCSAALKQDLRPSFAAYFDELERRGRCSTI